MRLAQLQFLGKNTENIKLEKKSQKSLKLSKLEKKIPQKKQLFM